MTKKDYRAIGQAIRAAYADACHDQTRMLTDAKRTIDEVADRIADVFACESIRFDRARFLRFVETGIDKPSPYPKPTALQLEAEANAKEDYDSMQYKPNKEESK